MARWNCSSPSPPRHPGAHQALRIGIECGQHPLLHFLQHFFLNRRHIGQTQKGAGFFGCHVDIDMEFHRIHPSRTPAL
jgi:hypothetical protein